MVKINIVIDSMVLDGFDNYESERIIAALESNLSQLVKNDNNRFSQSAMKRSKQSSADFDAAIETHSSADHNSIGEEIARSIYNRLS
jgi:hypothetical protein